MAEHTRVAMAEKDGEADQAEAETDLDPADGGPVEAAPLASTLIPTSIAASIASCTSSLTSTPSPPPLEPQNDLPRAMTLHHANNAPLEEEHEEGIEYALDYFGELEPDCATGYEAGDAGAVVEVESEVCEEPGLDEHYEYDWVDEVLAF